MYSTFKKRRKTGGSEEKLDLGFTFGLGIGALWQKNDCLQISVPAWSLTLLDLKLQAITFLFFHVFFVSFHQSLWRHVPEIDVVAQIALVSRLHICTGGFNLSLAVIVCVAGVRLFHIEFSATVLFHLRFPLTDAQWK